jgi:hypothetical protein
MVKLDDTLNTTTTQDLPDAFGFAGSNKQTAAIQLVCRYGVAQQLTEYGNRNGILVALGPDQGGTVASNVQATGGSLMVDNSDDKYWFTKSALVEIDSGPGMALANEGPGTTAVNEAVASSISFSAGFFGDQPTANGSFSSSVTTEMADFAVTDQSQLQAGQVKHLYRLAATSAGAFDSDSDAFKWDDSPVEPPALARSNLPLVSQGFWVCNEGFTGTSSFSITVTHVLLATDESLSIPPDSSKETSYVATLRLPPIDWSAIKPPPT